MVRTGMTVILFSLALWAFAPLPQGVRAETTGKPDLVIAYSTKTLADVDQKDALAALKIYMEELGRQVGYAITGCLYDSTDRMVQDVRAGKADVIALTTPDYVRLKGRIATEPAITHVRGGKSKHSFLILTRRDGPFSELGSLKNRRISVLKGDEVGMLFLNTTLLRQGFPEARSFFSSVDEKPKTSQVILSVFFGQADCGIVDDVAFRTMCELNPQIGRGLAVLSSSPDLATGISFFRGGLSAEAKAAILSWSGRLKDYPRGRQVLMLFKIDDIVPAKESNLESIKDLMADYERLQRRR
jgi:ABC-type phosphate/phosphonate transport system substrate-binding protein